jgi:hypothetical protein
VSNRVLSVREVFFFPGTRAKFEGHFIMNSSDPALITIANELKETATTIPKYQLLLKVKDTESYEITDCLIHRFELDSSELATCHFFCNDIEKID